MASQTSPQVHHGASQEGTAIRALETQSNQAVRKDNRPKNQSQGSPQSRKSTAATKVVSKVGNTLFNIFDQMKKTNLIVTLWEALSITAQRDLLQEALKNFSLLNDTSAKGVPATTSLCQPEEEEKTSKNKKPPFYVSSIIGDFLVHNCMTDGC